MGAFQKAVKQKQKARVTLDGPAGSGKTYSGLVIARELVGPNGKIAVIDSEHGSAALYADIFEFDHAELEDHAPQTYIKYIEQAHGYDALLIDSLSHAWSGKNGTLEQVDREKDKFNNGWRKMTPVHNKLVDALLSFPGHLITTLRTKTEYIQEKDEKTGKTTIKKFGTVPIQREGMEYEFTVVADMTIDGQVNISKTRCRHLRDQPFTHADVPKMARTLKAWLEAGAEAPAPKSADIVQLAGPMAKISALMAGTGKTKPQIAEFIRTATGKTKREELTDEDVVKVEAAIHNEQEFRRDAEIDEIRP